MIDLGRRGYLETLELQRRLRLARLDGGEPHDLLLVVEHEPTYTLGRATRDTSLPIARGMLSQRGATVVDVERGGDVTWHGPGQLVGYPILDLRLHQQDLHWYLRTLEAVLIASLARVGVTAGVATGKTGVWTGDRKIASIGVHVKQWVTLHGFALNVDPDLSWFANIVPCGLHGVEMTSVAREQPSGDREALWRNCVAAVTAEFGAAFRLAPQERSPRTLAHSPSG